MTICDKIKGAPGSEKDSLKAIVKRLGHPDPHIAIQAIVVRPFFQPPQKHINDILSIFFFVAFRRLC